jgi:hypothetical protein
MNLEFKYQFLNQRSLFEFKLKISYSVKNFEIQIIFQIIEITIFKFKYQVSNFNIVFKKLK